MKMYWIIIGVISGTLLIGGGLFFLFASREEKEKASLEEIYEKYLEEVFADEIREHEKEKSSQDSLQEQPLSEEER